MLVKMARPRGWPVGRPVLHPAGTFGGPNRSFDLYWRPSAHRRRLRCSLRSRAHYESNLSEVLVLIGRNGDFWDSGC